MPAERLLRDRRHSLAQPRAHHRQRVGGGQHGTMARARVVGVAMRDHCPVYRPQRVDEEAARLAEQAGGQDFQPGLGMRHDGVSWRGARV